MGKTRKEYEAELQKNIDLIKTVIPDFELTEEQKNKLLSEERINLHDKYQSVPDSSDKTLSDKKVALASKYFCAGSKPKAIARNWMHMAHDEKTEADIEYNKRMFTNLSRDDEVGEMARQNYLLEGVNQNFEIDNKIFSDDISMAEYTDYCFEHQDIGGTIMETEHFVNDFGESFVPKDKEKFNALRLYGASAGAAIRDQVMLVKKDTFLTFPTELLTAEQIEKVYGVISQVTREMPEEQKQLYADITLSLTVEKNKREAKLDAVKLEKAFKPGEKYTAADFSNPAPINERVGGGYAGRRKTIMEGCDLIASYSSTVEPEKYNAVKAAAAEYKEVLSTVSEVPTKEEQQRIIAAAKKQGQSIAQFIRSSGVKGSSDPRLKAMSSNLNKLLKTNIQFSREALLADLVTYHQEDVKQFNLSNNIGKKVGELNNLYEEFRVDTIYGEKQTLTSGDIYDIRNKMADILKSVDEKLVDEKVSSFEAEQYKSIKNTVSKQLKGMQRAVPGMTLDKALSGQAREIDITGRKFQTAGNACSMRKMMTITGEDGSRVEGYFTEFTNIGVEAAIERLQKHFDEKVPEKSDQIKQALAKMSAKNLEYYHHEDLKGDFPDTTVTIDEFIDMRSTIMAAVEERGNYDITNTPDGGVVSQRNVAMSDVAQLIGAEDCIARSTVVTIYNDGKPYTGSFMETVDGEDMLHPTQDSKLFNAKPDCLDNSPALKQIADIQVLDWICGNGDRHEGNMLYKFDENGKISGIKGIDNDLSFACQDEVFTMKMTSLEDMKYISSGVYNKLKDVTPETLKVTLSSSGLTEEEIRFTTSRLEKLNKALADNQIKVVKDEDFVKMKAEDFLGVGATAVSQIQKGIKTIQKMSPELKAKLPTTKKVRDDEPLDMFERVDSTQVGQNVEPLEEMLSEMEDAEKGVHFGSMEYANVKSALKQIVEASKLITQDGRLASAKNFEALDKAYGVLQAQCQKYNDRKTRQGAIKDGKIVADTKTTKRIEAVEKVSKFCKNMSKSLELAIKPYAKSERAMINAEADREKIEMLDPQTAGMQLKEWNRIALDEKATSREILMAAEEIKTIGKYMSEKRVSAKECGLEKIDLENAQRVIKTSRRLNAERVKAPEPKPVEKKVEQSGPVL